MLDKERIQKAEANIRRFIADGMLSRVRERNEKVLNILITNAQESLKVANLSYENNANLWTIVCSYYSMFYIANAVLYNIGYKVGDKIVHQVTADALIALVRSKLRKTLVDDYEDAQSEALGVIKADELLSHFDKEREKRGDLQYSTTEMAKKAKAETSLKRAANFYTEIYQLTGALK